MRVWCLDKFGRILLYGLLKLAEFMSGSILHKIFTKHGLSLGENPESNKLDINDDLSECKEIHLQMR